MADYHEERTLKAFENAKTKTETIAARLKTPAKTVMLEKDRKAR
jgi:hypothetical protein